MKIKGGKTMLSIGEFSRACKVTTRTLRHYDDIEKQMKDDISRLKKVLRKQEF